MAARVDSHQHFWKYRSDQYPWIPEGSPLHRDWLPEDLEALQTPLHIDGSVAVQARQTLEESRWLLQLADENPRILGVVGWVDLRSPDAARQMKELSRHPKFSGVRHVAQDEPDDRFLTGSDFQRGIRLLREFNLRYDLLIYPKQLPAAIELVRAHPLQPFVLDHCAKPPLAQKIFAPWAENIRLLSQSPNVLCKVSGIVTEDRWDAWSLDSLKPCLDVILECFGPERIMWGSDWPVCLLASSYLTWWKALQEWTVSWTTVQKEGFFGGNAVRFYGLDG